MSNRTLVIWVVAVAMMCVAFAGQAADTRAICGEVVGILATDFKHHAAILESPRVEIRQCTKEDGAKIQLLAWKLGASAPALIINTSDFGVVQSFGRANIFVVETGGATRDQVYVIEFVRGEPRVAVRRSTRGTAEIRASDKEVSVTITGIYAGDAPSRLESHNFALDVEATRPQ